MFARTLGDTSDVVMKEMYTFTDRGGDSITLRPEVTAGVCRALVTNGLTQSLPQQVFYAGPMFRYERPQKGRYRQFHQIDVEMIGAPEPLADAEVIACGWDILVALGIAGDVTLELNTLGDQESRDAYRAALVAYFTAHRDSLSHDSLDRLERNPMRILDSKDEGDRKLVGARADDRAVSHGERGRLLRRRQGASRRVRRAVRGEPAHRPRPRLLRPHRVRIRDVAPRRAGHGHGGRPLRGAGAGDGRARNSRRRLGVRRGAAGDAAAEQSGAAARRRRHPARRGGGERGASACCRRCGAAGIRAEMAYRGNLKRRMERANRIGARAADHPRRGRGRARGGASEGSRHRRAGRGAVGGAGRAHTVAHEQPRFEARPDRRAGRRTALPAVGGAATGEAFVRASQRTVGDRAGRRAHRRTARRRARVRPRRRRCSAIPRCANSPRPNCAT